MIVFVYPVAFFLLDLVVEASFGFVERALCFAEFISASANFVAWDGCHFEFGFCLLELSLVVVLLVFSVFIVFRGVWVKRPPYWTLDNSYLFQGFLSL